MQKSVWTKSVKLPDFNRLDGDKSTDVLIIGGGMCGILCAYFLEQAGVDYILAEGKKICSGVTENTTAKITSLHGLIYDKLIKSFGYETALKYLQINEKAIDQYAKLCKNIDCDFERRTAYTYSKSNPDKIENEVKAITSLGFSAEFIADTPLPFSVVGCVALANQAQFNPLKFIAGIAKDLKIYEDTFIRDITPTYAIYNRGKIKAKKIIIATHFPFINRHGSYFLKLYQHRSYVLGLENAPHFDGMYVDESANGLSLRSYDNLVLLGGGGHRTGKKGGSFAELEGFRKKYYPLSKPSYRWATQDCMSLDGIAYIGEYSANTPNLFTATGFNKWGMTTSMVSAMILTDLVQNKENEFADIFSPSRSIVKPQLLINGFETITNFMFPTTKRCSHLGCALKWNKSEHTWDCACHGSRFEKDGKVINNPATTDAKINNP